MTALGLLRPMRIALLFCLLFWVLFVCKQTTWSSCLSYGGKAILCTSFTGCAALQIELGSKCGSWHSRRQHQVGNRLANGSDNHGHDPYLWI